MHKHAGGIRRIFAIRRPFVPIARTNERILAQSKSCRTCSFSIGSWPPPIGVANGEVTGSGPLISTFHKGLAAKPAAKFIDIYSLSGPAKESLTQGPGLDGMVLVREGALRFARSR